MLVNSQLYAAAHLNACIAAESVAVAWNDIAYGPAPSKRFPASVPVHTPRVCCCTRMTVTGDRYSLWARQVAVCCTIATPSTQLEDWLAGHLTDSLAIV
jgi:hypothetical protein